MADEWIIQVEEKEYGPADLTTLREWKAEGRVLPDNPARRADSSTWDKAAEIPGLFEAGPPPVQRNEPPHLSVPVSTRSILPETFVIYARGFFKYLGLSLLVLGPALAAELTGEFIGGAPKADPNLRTVAGGAVIVCLFVLKLVLTPVYIAGIQILTAAFAAGERIGFFPTLNEAVKYWPRVAVLSLFVWLCYAFWTFMPLVLMAGILVGSMSILGIVLVLLVLALTVWIIGRLFVNFMFWQQFAVLEGCTALDALRRSRQLARSRIDLPWYRRPMWRGIFIVSVWSLVVFVLNWPLISQFYGAMTGTADVQKMMNAGLEILRNLKPAYAADVLHGVLKPLLGIAFVLLFLDSNMAAGK
jgi:hypothetical protein